MLPIPVVIPGVIAAVVICGMTAPSNAQSNNRV